MGKTKDGNRASSVEAHLKALEERISRIEAHLALEEEAREAPRTAAPLTGEQAEDALEFQLGQNWFAKTGIVVLALGIIFLLTFPYESLPPFFPSLVGYFLVAGIVGLSHYWRRTYDQVSRYLLGGGLLLAYFTTLRLTYFGTEPVITSTTGITALLVVVVAVNLTVAARRKSPWLIAQHLTLGYVTALIGEEPWFVFLAVTTVSVVAVGFAIRYRSRALILYSIPVAALTHFLWSINNPLLGNTIQFISSPEINLLFLLVCAAVFGAGGLLLERKEPENLAAIAIPLLNAFSAYGVFLILALGPFAAHAGSWHLAASLLFLALSVVAWVRGEHKYAPFVYAMVGYFALSVAIVTQFGFPNSFIWLCWQSVIVISTAVWFHSRLMIIANFAIFLMIFLGYLVWGGAISAVSISYGVVALLTARILNWQRNRLELKTEYMRNAYLVCALLFNPYALYHTVPSGYVSLSWLALALFYYIASRLLKNRKYRWLALLTTSLTIGYVFIVDMMGFNPTLRIISFLILGSALLAISMIYSRKRAKSAAGRG